ncbi:MAG TPA: sugar transferase [Candidatus Sulfotelmatobacter sp.]|nr:sugar transferase [Candidatus Sulfotelmatobacter sp.]
MSTQEVVKEQGDLLEVSHFAGTQIHRSLSHGRGTGLGAAIALLEAFIVVLSGFIAYFARGFLGEMLGISSLDITTAPALRLSVFLLTYACLTVICNAAQNLYSEAAIRSARVARVRIFKGFMVSSMMSIMIVFIAGEKAVPRLMVASTSLFSLAGVVCLRYVMERYNLKHIERGIGNQHVLIVGSGEVGQAFRCYLQSHAHLGKTFCGFVDWEPNVGPFCLGTPDDLPRILTENFIDEIYFTPATSRDLVVRIALEARRQRIGVKVVPDLYGGLAIGAGMNYIGSVPVLELNRQPIPALGLFVKRIMDLFISSVTVVLTAPIMLVTAIAIKFDSPGGPILYKAWRVGRKGRKFMCYKFRTMVVDADARKNGLMHMNERNGATFKITDDPRITRLGRFLRKYSIDELPQLFNVLKGDMSVVGPRPHPEDDFKRYDLEHFRRLDVTPGLTCLWQVTARHDPSFEKNVSLDLEYIENWNVLLDVKIILMTVPVVFRGSGL